MKESESKRMIFGNMVLWVVAALMYPICHWIPTSSGAPPKIFELLIPVIVVLMGIASTSFLRSALRRKDGR